MAWRISIGAALAVGVAAAVVVPIVIPAVARAARPLARTAVKTGIILYEKGREEMAKAGEDLDDLIAEARAELAEDNPFAAPADAAPPAAEESAPAS